MLSPQGHAFNGDCHFPRVTISLNALTSSFAEVPRADAHFVQQRGVESERHRGASHRVAERHNPEVRLAPVEDREDGPGSEGHRDQDRVGEMQRREDRADNSVARQRRRDERRYPAMDEPLQQVLLQEGPPCKLREAGRVERLGLPVPPEIPMTTSAPTIGSVGMAASLSDGTRLSILNPDGTRRLAVQDVRSDREPQAQDLDEQLRVGNVPPDPDEREDERQEERQLQRDAGLRTDCNVAEITDRPPRPPSRSAPWR